MPLQSGRQHFSMCSAQNMWWVFVKRAAWLVGTFGQIPDAELEDLVRKHIGKWGAEFAMESVLWEEGVHVPLQAFI